MLEKAKTSPAISPQAIFLAAPVGCSLVAFTSLWRWTESGATWLVAVGILYIVGTFLVTVAFNVPMNNALDAVQPTAAGAGALWTRYLADWTAWNPVRAVASSLAATALIAAGLRLSDRRWGQPFTGCTDPR